MPHFQIHPLLIFFIIVSILTGTFFHLFIIFIIVLWHELGHFMMAKYFHWRIDSIMLWVFGGVMKTDEHGTCPLYEDILVTMAGPLQHLFIFLTLILLESFQIVPPSIIHFAHQYNIVILLFNLLPIYPLDGGKLMFYLFSLFLPYRKAYHLILMSSMGLAIGLLIIQSIFFPFTLSVILIMLFLLFENNIEWRNRRYVFRRFLLSRLNLAFHYKNVETIHVLRTEQMIDIFAMFKREKTYKIKILDSEPIKEFTEKDCLHAFFYRQKLIRYIGDLI